MNFQMSKESRMNYIARRKEELANLTAALLNSDFRALEVAGHQIKGSARSYGFDSLTTIANDLEIFARAKNAEMTTATLKALEAGIDKLQL
ncbi:MAG: Hpt domain-containing protein [Bdellovibrionales bacterium]|nr:Hpt domain-containing protein [Bdellovibrionales bacterium]